MLKVKELDELKSVIANNGKVIVKIGAEWCGPCRMVEKTLKDIEDGNISDAVIAVVDVDESDDIVQEYDIMSVPVMLFYKNGEVINKHIGSMSKDEILKVIE